MRNTFANAVMEACDNRRDVFICSGDAGLGVFDDFQNTHSEHFLNMGVAEQNMIGFSAGLAMTGFKVFCYNIIPFVLYRCYEQVRNDICYQRLPVVLAGIGSGVAYAPAGMTHYSVEDIGIARTLPNLTVFSPIDPAEAACCAEYALDATEPVYVRLAKRGEPGIHKDEQIDITLPCILRTGREIAVITHGAIAAEVLAAADLLQEHNIYPRVISVTQIQPLNLQALQSALQGIRTVMSIEEHFVGSGLGSILAGAWAGQKNAPKLLMWGIPDAFIHAIRAGDRMREEFGLSAPQIADRIKMLVEKGDE
ncbi:MAG: hypothetical protein JW828_08960 [Sedimentisphaerales bacterium]|nr:hypothetical protein [Sedimentisphaerales bacterium]